MQPNDSTGDSALVRLYEAQHRFRNALQMIASVSRRELRKARSAETREALSYVCELTTILGQLQQKLDAPDGVSDLSWHLIEFGKRWQRFANGQYRIVVEAPEPILLPAAAVRDATLIVHELVVNSMKHAFPDGRLGTISIRVRRSGEIHAMLTVEDDGVGVAEPTRCIRDRSDQFDHGTTFVKTLAEALGGTIHTGGGPGTGHVVSVRWPL